MSSPSSAAHTQQPPSKTVAPSPHATVDGMGRVQCIPGPLSSSSSAPSWDTLHVQINAWDEATSEELWGAHYMKFLNAWGAGLDAAGAKKAPYYYWMVVDFRTLHEDMTVMVMEVIQELVQMLRRRRLISRYRCMSTIIIGPGTDLFHFIKDTVKDTYKAQSSMHWVTDDEFEPDTRGTMPVELTDAGVWRRVRAIQSKEAAARPVELEKIYVNERGGADAPPMHKLDGVLDEDVSQKKKKKKPTKKKRM